MSFDEKLEEIMEKQQEELTSEKKLKILETIVKDIFGYSTVLDFRKWKWEQDKVIIKNIDFMDFLIPALSRLQEHFSIDLDVEVAEEEVEISETEKKKFTYGILNVELTRFNSEGK